MHLKIENLENKYNLRDYLWKQSQFCKQVLFTSTVVSLFQINPDKHKKKSINLHNLRLEELIFPLRLLIVKNPQFGQSGPAPKADPAYYLTSLPTTLMT